MLKVSEEDRKFLIENIKDAEALLAGDDLNALLDPPQRLFKVRWL